MGRNPVSVRWMRSGANTTTSAVVVVACNSTFPAAVKVTYDTDPAFGSPETSAPVAPDSDGYAKVPLSGLSADTLYYYRGVLDDTPDAGLTGKLRTFPTSGTVTFMQAGDNFSASNHAVWTKMAEKDSLFFVHTGDWGYANNSVNTTAAVRGYYEDNMTAANQKAFWAGISAAYVWDNHDWGSVIDRTNPAAPATHAAYTQCMPHYSLAHGIAQTWKVGSILFIMSDLRTFRDPTPANYNAGVGATMLGSGQVAWLEDLLTQSCSDGTKAIVWFNTQPWDLPPYPHPLGGMDPTWGPYWEERDNLCQFMAELDDLPPVIVCSSDSHDSMAMLRWVNQGQPFSIFQSAPIHQNDTTNLPRFLNHWDVGPTGVTGSQNRYSTLSLTPRVDGRGVDVEWINYRVMDDASESVTMTLKGTVRPKVFERARYYGQGRRRIAGTD